jgi:hypothetical protein
MVTPGHISGDHQSRRWKTYVLLVCISPAVIAIVAAAYGIVLQIENANKPEVIDQSS